MSRPTRLGRPPASDSAATRDRILSGARSCFVARGYDQTTMKDIAAAADMTAGALYHHFTSKPQLFAEVYHEHQASTFAQFEEAASGEGGLVDKVCRLLDKAADLHAMDHQLAAFTAVATIELQRHPELRTLVRRDSHTVYRFFDDLVATAPDEVAGEDREGVIDMLVAMFTGFSIFGAGTRSAAPHRATTCGSVPRSGPRSRARAAACCSRRPASRRPASRCTSPAGS